jgi:hypothetical protein
MSDPTPTLVPVSSLTGIPCAHPADHRCGACVSDTGLGVSLGRVPSEPASTCACCVEGQRVGMYDTGGKRSGVCAGCGHMVREHAPSSTHPHRTPEVRDA